MSTSKVRAGPRKAARRYGPPTAMQPPNVMKFMEPAISVASKKANAGFVAGISAVKASTGVVESIDDVIRSGGNWESFYRTRGLDRIAMIHEGVQAATFRGLASRVKRPVSELSRSLGLAPSTMRRKAKEGEKLSTADSERVLGFVSLIGQIDEMLGEARPLDFDSATWVSQWLQVPHPALGGRKPDEMLDTTTGQSLVSDLLASTASGSYW